MSFIQTLTFNLGTDTDYGGVFGGLSVGTWPPPSGTSASTSGQPSVSYEYFTGPQYRRHLTLVRFDTSLIATRPIVAARLNLGVLLNNSSQKPNLQAEYYSSSNWPIDTSDYTTANMSAPLAFNIAGTTWSAWATGAYASMPLSNTGSISTNGYTGLRLAFPVDTAPTAQTIVTFDRTTRPPYLEVDVRIDPYHMMV